MADNKTVETADAELLASASEDELQKALATVKARGAMAKAAPVKGLDKLDAMVKAAHDIAASGGGWVDRDLALCAIVVKAMDPDAQAFLLPLMAKREKGDKSILPRDLNTVKALGQLARDFIEGARRQLALASAVDVSDFT